MLSTVLLTREAVIVLGVASAVCVTAGSLIRVFGAKVNRLVPALLINGGYCLLGLSMLIYIVIGFR
ncbi:MAG TPA: hypothetical protein VK654_16985 [Nitrospirota bacterium]|nr:hypothetical protein [Nitrospirota bacterium]